MNNCDTCVHARVCSLKDKYSKAVEAINNAEVYKDIAGDCTAIYTIRAMKWLKVELRCEHYDRSPAKAAIREMAVEKNCGNCKYFNHTRLNYAGPCISCTSGTSFNQPSNWEAKE